MSEDQIALARRAVACRGWRWLRGMLRHDDYRYVGSGVWARWSDTASVMTALHMPDQLPDLTDTATLGCLLALVREAWGDLGIFVRPRGSKMRPDWAVFTGEHSDIIAVGADEAEALVVALEAKS